MRAHRPAIGLLTGLVVVASSVVSCRRQEDLPPPPVIVRVNMNEFGFHYDRKIPAGRVLFQVRNTGRLKHELVLLRLPDDFPPIDVQLHSKQRRPVPTLALLPARSPGQIGTFAADLTPGRYAMLCGVLDDPDPVPHALKGMNSEFVVRSTGSSRDAPARPAEPHVDEPPDEGKPEPEHR